MRIKWKHVKLSTASNNWPVKKILPSINQQTTRAGEDVEKREPLGTVGGNADWCSHCGKQYGATSKIKNTTAYDKVLPLLGIYYKKPETLIGKNICAPMLIALLFTIAKIWKQPKCPSVDKWIKLLWYIYTMGYYSVTKSRNIYLCDNMDGPGEDYTK